MEQLRLLLVIALVFTSFQLWQAWRNDYAPHPAPAAVPDPATTSTPDQPPPPPSGLTPAAVAPPTTPPAALVTLQTDVLRLFVSPTGATITAADLLDYPTSTAQDAPAVALLGEDATRTFVYQSGWTGSPDLPTHHSPFTASAAAFALATGEETLSVPFTWSGADGLRIEKRLVLRRASYTIDIIYTVTNGRSSPVQLRPYEQLKRNEESSKYSLVYTFTGAAFSTPAKPFTKYDLDDLRDQPIATTTSDGWIGVIQHYFVTALIPPAAQENAFYSNVLDDQHYVVGYHGPLLDVAAGGHASTTVRAYIGPKRHDIISTVAPALELSVDYAMLWFIGKPIFLALRFLHDLTNNWGYAIIILTFLLKLAFFPLSAAGYRSMANMRRVQPRMLALRDRYKDDRAQLNQAMMKLYKDEKINPLGGCLPILVQIPVFIALYWVLLESVEMRQAPFVLWIADLSERDPWFVLPLLMGITMWIQQKLNPAPIDPMQAKVMQIMPFVFTVFFAFFPAGLVLYWLVNNILSIAQQWQITRAIEGHAG
jgi:YidC/Oxa1 family membrane protein insertase